MSAQTGIDRDGIRRIGQVVFFLVLLCGSLFGAAGQLDWWAGWVFLIMLTALSFGLALWMKRHDPELLNERGRSTQTASRHEQLILALNTLFQFGIYITAGLDQRFGWSAVPLAFQIAGGLGLAACAVIVFRVMQVNTYASAVARVQEDRAHHVITGGPYRYVRHPMYLAIVLMGLLLPLMLGSWWALLPGGMLSALFVYRTAQEDALLRRELDGYEDFTRHTRFRLIPGLW